MKKCVIQLVAQPYNHTVVECRQPGVEDCSHNTGYQAQAGPRLCGDYTETVCSSSLTGGETQCGEQVLCIAVCSVQCAVQ